MTYMQIVISREAAYETLKVWVVVAARKGSMGSQSTVHTTSASGAFALLL